LQLTWKVNSALTVVVGRQLMNVDDQRFVGTTTWRQDEQTFDATKADIVRGKFSANCIYLAGVNHNLDRDWRSDSHALILGYTVAAPLRIETFDYALDVSNTLILSTDTAGARASGRFKFDGAKIRYALIYAHQGDYRRINGQFSLDYEGVTVDAVYGLWSDGLAYEVLGGDGKRGFVTPSQTNNGLQGWADAFSAVGGAKTFVDGL